MELASLSLEGIEEQTQCKHINVKLSNGNWSSSTLRAFLVTLEAMMERTRLEEACRGPTQMWWPG